MNSFFSHNRKFPTKLLGMKSRHVLFHVLKSQNFVEFFSVLSLLVVGCAVFYFVVCISHNVKNAVLGLMMGPVYSWCVSGGV